MLSPREKLPLVAGPRRLLALSFSRYHVSARLSRKDRSLLVADCKNGGASLASAGVRAKSVSVRHLKKPWDY